MPRSRSRSPARSSRSRYDDNAQGRSRHRDSDRRPSNRDSPRGEPYHDRKGEGRSYRDRDRGYDDRRTRERDGRGGEEGRNRDRPRDRERGGDRREHDDSRGPSRDERSRYGPTRSRSRSRSPSASTKKKEEPNFGNSGILAAATNTVKLTDGTSTLLKYNEPPEARKPSQGWRLYVFKGKEDLGLLHIEKQSAYLIGRDQAIADISIDHPSCSKQHAVIQYRQVAEKDEWGVTKPAVKPFIIDLESTNGTHVNDDTIPTSRYYELKPSDVIKFGQSTREYVLLNEEV